MSVTSVNTGRTGAGSAGPGRTAATPIAGHRVAEPGRTADTRPGYRQPGGCGCPERAAAGLPERTEAQRHSSTERESGERRSGTRTGHGPAGRGVRGAVRPVPHARRSGHRRRRLPRLPLLRLHERRDDRRYGYRDDRRYESRDDRRRGRRDAPRPRRCRDGARSRSPGHRPPRARVPGRDRAGEHGAVCVSTPARDRSLFGPAGLSGLAVLALLAVRPLRVRPVLLGGTGRRGPPASGRSLLLRVCVARV